MKSLLYSNKGITLVELLIVIALMSIVIMGATSAFIFGQRTFSKGSDQYELQNNARFAVEEISNELRFATKILINPDLSVEDVTGMTKIDYVQTTGLLVIQEPDGSVRNFKISKPNSGSLSFSPSSSDSSIIKSTIIGQAPRNNNQFNLENEMLCLNLKMINFTINSGSSSVLYYEKDLESMAYLSDDDYQPLTILSFQDVPDITIEQFSSLIYPKATANMSDGTTLQFNVSWNQTIDTNSATTQTTTGTVEGFTLNLTVNVQPSTVIGFDPNPLPHKYIVVNQTYTPPSTANVSLSSVPYSKTVGPISWNYNGYSPNVVGQYLITGTAPGIPGTISQSIFVTPKLSSISVSQTNNQDKSPSDVTLTPSNLEYSGTLKNNTAYIRITATSTTGTVQYNNARIAVSTGQNYYNIKVVDGPLETSYTLILTKP